MKLLPAALVAALFAVPASAAQMSMQVNCGPRAEIVGELQARFGEQQIGIGIPPNAAAEVWANPETGTWTWLLSLPRTGQACVVAVGQDWETLEPEPAPPDGDPA